MSVRRRGTVLLGLALLLAWWCFHMYSHRPSSHADAYAYARSGHISLPTSLYNAALPAAGNTAAATAIVAAAVARTSPAAAAAAAADHAAPGAAVKRDDVNTAIASRVAVDQTPATVPMATVQPAADTADRVRVHDGVPAIDGHG